MSFCEHMIERADTAKESSAEQLLNIQNELVWGLTYRNYKENEKNKPIAPMHSPINIPFELCRAEMLRKRKPKFEFELGSEEEEADNVSADKAAAKTKRRKKRKIAAEKPSLLSRSTWPQNKYMDFLSTPNPTFFQEPKKKKYKKRCELEPCPPRFTQLAVPNKRRVFANWKEYAHFLPTETLMRFEEILHTDQNLEPREARYYYKKLDRQKRKDRKRKRRLQKKRKQDEEKVDWQMDHIYMLASDVVDYIKDEPLFALNYKQMLLSDAILDRLGQTNLIKKPNRKTKNHFNKTVIEVSDKFAIWIDTLTKFVDVQAVESDEDIPPLSISSLSGESEGEDEGESDYDSSSDEQLRDDQFFEPAEGMWDDEDEGGMGQFGDKDMAEDIMKEFFKPGEGEEAAEFEEMLNNLDEDVLEKLIEILSNCSDDFLDGEIDADKMPGVTYRDVLDKLKALRDGLASAGGKPFLEQIMIDWALRNDPDRVNDDILKKIHEVAGLLGDFLSEKKPDKVVEGETGEGEIDGGDAGEGDEQGEVETEDARPAEEQAVDADDEDAGVEDTGPAEVEAEDAGAEVPAAEDAGAEGPAAEDAGAEGPAAEAAEGPAAEAAEGPAAEAAEVGGEDVAEPEGEQPTGEDEEDIQGEAEGMEAESHITDLGEFELEQEGGFDLGGVSDFEGEEGEGEFIAVDEGVGAQVSSRAMLKPIEVGAAVSGVPGVEDARGLEGKIIKGHKPSKVFEHAPDTVCCLSLKTWATWLLEITHNAHNWTQWMSCVIQQIRQYAAMVRGDVKGPDGEVTVLRKAEWRKFIKETEESIVAWRQYSAHVKDLSQSIVENFHDKKVNCCPKCLQDHLITNVVVAHETLQALTEAISCAAYWQRCLDTLVDRTSCLTKESSDDEEAASSDEFEYVDIEEVEQRIDESEESEYEIEDMESQILKGGSGIESQVQLK